MRVLMAFSKYRHHGGEEQSTATESQLLRSAGHEVEVLSIPSPVQAGRMIRSTMQTFRPDIVHIQNFFPSVQTWHYAAIREFGCPIVQSLRNYRLTCIAANQWRDDRSCHDCSFDNHRPGVQHGCYRGSRPQSAVAAAMLRTHRTRGTWTEHVSAFIAVSEHVRASVEPSLGDVPIFVKPNTVITDHVGTGAAGNVVYAGRLSPEKGILELATTWALDPNLPELAIIGDGPLRPQVDELALRSANITALGSLPHDQTLVKMGEALATIAPWKWDEPFGRSLMESLAVGTPVLTTASTARRFQEASGAVFDYRTDSLDSLREVIEARRHHQASERAASAEVFAESFSPLRNLEVLVELYKHLSPGI